MVKGLFIISDKEKDLELLSKLADRMGLPVKTLSGAEILDLGLITAMEEGRDTPVISSDNVIFNHKRLSKPDSPKKFHRR